MSAQGHIIIFFWRSLAPVQFIYALVDSAAVRSKAIVLLLSVALIVCRGCVRYLFCYAVQYYYSVLSSFAIISRVLGWGQGVRSPEYLLVRTPSRSNWTPWVQLLTPWVQLLLEGGTYGAL